ncbi:MAG: site-2 protease family protein [Bacteroidota bacterium]|nr:site-2 protease family protein [Bacteroidota bacterium]
MAAPTLKGGLPLFRFRGIRVFVHWTFLILPAWIAFGGYTDGKDVSTILAHIGLVLIIFMCVVLHEFGHALTAQRFGIGTWDITLLPIGGVASLERMPEDPKQEFLITVAGPLVNLVIAGIGFLVLAATGVSMLFSGTMLNAASWTSVIMFVVGSNLVLFFFNLIPAFPMDGGRILRSLLSMKMPREKATTIAAGLGRIIAIGFVIYGFYDSQPFVALIGVFIFFAAGAEARNVRQQSLLRGIRVGDVMRTRFWNVPSHSTVQQALDDLLAGGDRVLVVLENGLYKGVLHRDDLMKAVSEGRSNAALSELDLKQPPTVTPADGAHASHQQMTLGSHPILPVMEDGSLIGILEPENLAEFIQLKQARSEAAGPRK